MKIADTKLNVWEERDRLHVELVDKETEQHTFAEWWDDDARQMFEDGFFKRGKSMHQSVFDYANEMGMLTRKRRKNPMQTIDSVRLKLLPLGMTIRHRDGEYRVNFKNGPESSAYYTNDLSDAYNTAVEMTRRAFSGTRQKNPRKKNPGQRRPFSITMTELNRLRRVAQQNADQFKQKYVLFSDTSGKYRVERLSSFFKTVPSDSEIFEPRRKKNPLVGYGRISRVVLKGDKMTVARALADAGVPFAFFEQAGVNTVGDVAKQYIPRLVKFLKAHPEFEGRYAGHQQQVAANIKHRGKNPIKGPGKFEGETYAARYAYDNVDEDLGDVQTFDWYGKFSGKIKGRGPFHIIVRENNQGFVYGEFFKTEAELNRQWRRIERAWDKFSDEDEQ
jgi:hypothetical protein